MLSNWHKSVVLAFDFLIFKKLDYFLKRPNLKPKNPVYHICGTQGWLPNWHWQITDLKTSCQSELNSNLCRSPVKGQQCFWRQRLWLRQYASRKGYKLNVKNMEKQSLVFPCCENIHHCEAESYTNNIFWTEQLTIVFLSPKVSFIFTNVQSLFANFFQWDHSPFLTETALDFKYC